MPPRYLLGVESPKWIRTKAICVYVKEYQIDVACVSMVTGPGNPLFEVSKCSRYAYLEGKENSCQANNVN
eukprot:jgi/Botrbrau1/14399/Bobra.0014s0046.1